MNEKTKNNSYAARAVRSFFSFKTNDKLGILIALIVLVIISAIMSPSFLNARNLNQTADWIASQPQIMFHGNLRGILNLLVRTAHSCSQPGSSHRTGNPDLTLAPDFCAGNRSVGTVQAANPRSRQKKLFNAFRRAETGFMNRKTLIIADYRRHNAG